MLLLVSPDFIDRLLFGYDDSMYQFIGGSAMIAGAVGLEIEIPHRHDSPGDLLELAFDDTDFTHQDGSFV